MPHYLHKSLCDLSKATKPGRGKSDQTGEQRGGDYFHRIQTGYSKKTNQPTYRYFKTKDEYDAYTGAKDAAGKKTKKKTGDEGAKRLKEKLSTEQSASSQKTKDSKDSLFLKDKNKKLAKSLYIKVA